ncbi:threonyl-tRNA synthetase [Anaerosphaera aminiphila DSM 21120]|uniref:Threonine--tRNA ligase n=1 Tax=Anaerosphaera aminiphila DSM 21120 TaxID=1120995 RepID=A0A1M5P6X0_9FIRM|nr:threonine--tRNA ligase [Anaerosphaera aminiphila]SHG97189.1 threonyl-tRNA synthetase [Anaerosphaera aminiphila DSM 21120]
MIIKLPDGSEREYESKKTVKEITMDISEGLARVALGAVVNGETLGMKDEVTEDAEFKVVKFEDKEGKQIFWHTTSHVMAYAIQNLFDNVKFAIGPSIDNGFYYDVDLEHRFIPEDLEKIEAEMKKIIKEGYEVEKISMTKKEATEFFKEKNQDYKLELIEGLEDEEVGIYKIGDFYDLCKGPHLENIKSIKAIKLLSIAGAYWRGDENNKMLQRIYGISFEKKKQLDEYIERMEEAEKRDHRKLGRELDLFSMHEEGPGFPFFHPNGMILRNELLNWWRDILIENGYGEIQTPIILSEALWHKSGHWDHYKENMYFTKIDGEDYAIKPMNCPGSTIVYATSPHSYKELPIRYSEYGQVHRHELSGALHGLFRVRTFTQDDAHVFCLPEQIEDEVFKMIDLADFLYSTFGFKYKIELSTRPDDFMGDIETWNMAEKSLQDALEKRNMEYTINEGDGAFYGPKIDFHLEDAIGRTWQCGTIQLDFQMPVNFDLTYVTEKGEKARPAMLHRALFGSIERFLGILIEHFAGKFPLWLSPTQVEVIPVSEKFNDYAKKVVGELKKSKIRVNLDERAEKVGYKIREAQLKKINYMLVIGEQEVNSGKLSVRKRNGEELKDVSIDDFISNLKEEIETKEITE